MHKDWDIEIKRLDFIKEVICEELTGRLQNSDALRKQQRVTNKEMWEDVGALSGFSDSAVTFMQHIGLLKQNISAASENTRKIEMLERQLYSHYFGRIDFKEDDAAEAA